MTFNIDQSRPIYKQLVEQILTFIKQGELAPGDRLPTERELSAQLSVARGTVKKAYSELADNNIIEVIQGSGSYVHGDGEIFNGERRKIAMELMDETIAKLDFWDFSMKEIETMIKISLARRARTDRLVRIAVIDCNPESLSIFKKQLMYIPNILISVFMVESIIMDDDPHSLVGDYDLILTTETHYEQIAKSLDAVGAKFLRVSMSPSRHTIMSAATLEPKTKIGIVCSSNKFANLICEQLNFYLANEASFGINFETNMEDTIKFIKNYGAIVLSPDSLLFESRAGTKAIEKYASEGGKIIPFDYLIERGSLIHIEERIADILKEKYNLG